MAGGERNVYIIFGDRMSLKTEETEEYGEWYVYHVHKHIGVGPQHV